MEVLLLHTTTPTSNLTPIFRRPYGWSDEWVMLIRWVSRQEVATTVVIWNNDGKTKYEKHRFLKALSLSFSYLWAPHADLSSLSYGQVNPSLRMHNLHLCVGDRPSHRFVFAGSFHQMRNCWRSLCHSISCRRRQIFVALTRAALNFTIQLRSIMFERTLRTKHRYLSSAYVYITASAIFHG
jgi:hypothetical protein